MDKEERNAILARLGFTLDIESYTQDRNGSHHYTICILRDGAEWFTTPFSQGSAVHHDPELVDIFYCLMGDVSAFRDVVDQADFLCQYGYNKDATQLRWGFWAYEASRVTAEKFDSLDASTLQAISDAVEGY